MCLCCILNKYARKFLCGDLTFKDQQQSLTPQVKKCYKLYFEYKVEDEGKIGPLHLMLILCKMFDRLG